MDLTSWSRQLADRDLIVVPPSFVVPVQLWMLARPGFALRYRCRGTRVRLAVFDPSAVLIAVGAPTCGCGCGSTALAPVSAGSVAARPQALPRCTVEIDGAREYGWKESEAGRLPASDAAALLDRLLDRLPPRLWTLGAQSVATGRSGSLTQSDQEPTYNDAGTPASDKASTSWAALTPEPQ